MLEFVLGHSLLAASERPSPASARSESVVTVTASTDHEVSSRDASMQAGRMDRGLAKVVRKPVLISVGTWTSAPFQPHRHLRPFLVVWLKCPTHGVLVAVCSLGGPICPPSSRGLRRVVRGFRRLAKRRRAPLTANLCTPRGVLRSILPPSAVIQLGLCQVPLVGAWARPPELPLV